MARKRILRPEEEALWQAVARSAKALHPHRHASAKAPDPASSTIADLPARLAPAAAPLPAFRIGERVAGLASKTAALPGGGMPQPLHMDARSFERMSRGKLVPEARLDLHGMTLAEAHPELLRFIFNAQGQGLRLVLVITGKGKPGDDRGPIPRPSGVLRAQAPQWLRQPPLSSAILQVAEAHRRHGGSGALYVYLRRGR